ncbi:MAG: UDP-3-O-(3-hydroxymyristoyl)glucosamine N-acyltransferase [Candidatus Paracaedibacteraceae bacterium]|nr:UDP-3-O-(3-hydroxymyristoyl)glucosamine N-acyltransferase [Candidatus Paracaedibacteraceae bacterium]
MQSICSIITEPADISNDKRAELKYDGPNLKHEANMQFHNKLNTISLGAICDLLSLPIPDNSDAKQTFLTVSTLKDGDANTIALFHNAKYRTEAAQTRVGLCLTTVDFAPHLASTTIALIHPKPLRAFAVIARALYPTITPAAHIHKTAIIDPTATIGEGCIIGPYAVIGANVNIGARTRIDSHTVIHENVSIGKESYIASQVAISHSIIGDRILVKPGTHIGQQGFGFHMDEAGHFDVPQLGAVIIGNDVQIGANVCIDRGSLDNTVIGNGVRIDNLVQIAHNVHIGDQSVIVAQAGIAGSSHLGRFVILAGQVGVAGHINIGNGAKVAAQSGLMRDVADGETVAGTPAVPVRDWHKQTIALQRLIREKKSAK